MVKAVEQTNPNRCICTECGTTLEYDREDVFVGLLGRGYIKCPVCRENILIEDGNRVILPQFPKTFFVFESGCELGESETNEYIQQVIQYLKKDREAPYMFTGRGDTAVVGLRSGDEIIIFVARKYYEDVIAIKDWERLINN